MMANDNDSIKGHGSFIIIGAGGHGKVVADSILSSGQEVLGFIDDYVSKSPIDGISVIGNSSDVLTIMSAFPCSFMVAAIGDNASRRSMVSRLNAWELSWGTVVHPNSTVSRYACIGKGTVIMPGVIVNAGATIGDHVILNTACAVDHDCVIHDHAHLSPGVCLAGGVVVEEGAHIGTGTSIIPDRVVGAWSVVGAGACVINNIPPGVVAAGVPAKVLRARDLTL